MPLKRTWWPVLRPARLAVPGLKTRRYVLSWLLRGRNCRTCRTAPPDFRDDHLDPDRVPLCPGEVPGDRRLTRPQRAEWRRPGTSPCHAPQRQLEVSDGQFVARTLFGCAVREDQRVAGLLRRLDLQQQHSGSRRADPSGRHQATAPRRRRRTGPPRRPSTRALRIDFEIVVRQRRHDRKGCGEPCRPRHRDVPLSVGRKEVGPALGTAGRGNQQRCSCITPGRGEDQARPQSAPRVLLEGGQPGTRRQRVLPHALRARDPGHRRAS